MVRPLRLPWPLTLLAAAVLLHGATVAADPGDGRAWYLACTGEDGGDGSLEAPFGRPADAVLAAAAGDSIVVLPVADPALGCVVELAPGQRLVGADTTTRARVTRVVAAPGAVVADLDIVGSEREAVVVVGGEVAIRDVAIRAASTGVAVRGGDARVVLERVAVDGTAGDAVLVVADGPGAVDLRMQGCSVRRCARGVTAVAGGDAPVAVAITSSRFEDVDGAACDLRVDGAAVVEARLAGLELSRVGLGVVGVVWKDASLRLAVDGLDATDVEVTGVNLVLDTTSTADARLEAVVTGGRIAKAGGSGHGVRMTASGAGAMSVRVEGVAIDGGVDFDRGVSAEARDGDARLDVALVGNRVEVGPAALEGILVRARDGSTVCAEVRDNVVEGGSVGIAAGHRDGGRLEVVADRDGEVDAPTAEELLRAANRALVVTVTAEEPVRLVTACGRAPRADGG